jgi:hypothetical protein
MRYHLNRWVGASVLCFSGFWFATGVQAQIPVGPCQLSRTMQVSADASPHLDSSQPGIQVSVGTQVQLAGTARIFVIRADCEDSETLATLTWSLTFQPTGGDETDVTSSLGPKSAQTLNSPSVTSFTATSQGVYRARVRGTGSNVSAVTRLAAINVSGPPAGVNATCGRVNFLRVHDVGGRFGPPNDEIDVEVVAKLNTAPARAMGFQLRADGNAPARSGMLDLLRDAFNNNANVCLDYFLVPGRNNGIIIRVALTK